MPDCHDVRERRSRDGCSGRRTMGWKMALCLSFTVLCCLTPRLSAEENSALWQALELPGHVALLRHAIAPGTGDPPAFTLGDCGTQRNLSDEGRDQAMRIGARFAAHGIRKARVLSSQWCRCLETAALLGLGATEELSLLNSFFESPERRDVQTEGLKDWLIAEDLAGPTVLVTHQVNITALTGVYPTSGELVVIRRSKSGDLAVVGTIKPN